MSVYDWAANFIKDLSKNPGEAVTHAFYDAYVGALRRAPTETGPNPLDEDWEVLVILDACRPDQLKLVASEYDWVPEADDIETRRAPAGRSDEWMETIFEDEDLSSIVYITGNPFAAGHINDEEFNDVVHVYENHWDDDQDVMPPRPITAHGIQRARQEDFEDIRIILHYMQPHFPSIPALEQDEFTFGTGGLYQRWKRVRTGDIRREKILSAYQDNLRFILDEVSMLRRNLPVDDITITADHATALGEWGIYGHSGLPLKSIRTVPWLTVSASDTGEYEPDMNDVANKDRSIEDQLSALGYK